MRSVNVVSAFGHAASVPLPRAGPAMWDFAARATIALHAKTAPMARSVTSVDPLAPLAPDTLRAIAATGVARNYSKNTILINEGDVGDSLFIVISGRVKVYSSNPAGREVV